MEATIQEPKGIPFFSVKTGETHYCKLEPTISAYINSSNMGINASRGQDYGWRLGADWVRRVKAFRRNQTQMSILTAKNQGQKPTTVHILYYLYGEELQAYYERQEESENPFEEQYEQEISGKGARAEAPVVPQALSDFQAEDDEDMGDLIDDVITEDEESEAPAQPPVSNDHVAKGAEQFPEAPKQLEVTGVDLAKPGADKSVETKVTQKDSSKASQKKQ